MGKVDTTSGTVPKTLWTETILELLFQALENHRPDKDIKKILREVIMKGYKRSYIVEKVYRKAGEEAGLRVKNLLQK